MNWSEELVKSAEFELVSTIGTEAGEVEVYLSEELPGFRIMIHLAPDPGGRTLSYANMELAGPDGQPLRILDEHGRPLERELAEVEAWEAIEYLDSVMACLEGRLPSRRADGTALPAGEVIQHQVTQRHAAVAEPA